jgi:hypothetical protein
MKHWLQYNETVQLWHLYMQKAHKWVFPEEIIRESYCPLIVLREFPSGQLIVHEVWPATSNSEPEH